MGNNIFQKIDQIGIQMGKHESKSAIESSFLKSKTDSLTQNV